MVFMEIPIVVTDLTHMFADMFEWALFTNRWNIIDLIVLYRLFKPDYIGLIDWALSNIVPIKLLEWAL